MKHSPKSLRDIVGQPPVRHLQAYVDYVKSGVIAPRSFLLVGPPGTGKTASAQAVAYELGCIDEWTDGWTFACSDLGIDKAKDLFQHWLKFMPRSTSRMKVLILEEMEWLSPQVQRYLKVALDPLGQMPDNLCVVATSNDTKGIDRAILSRFKKMPFSNGESFKTACQNRLRHLWSMQVHGEGMPCGWEGWGRNFEDSSFDMRSALQSLDEALAERELCAA